MKYGSEAFTHSSGVGDSRLNKWTDVRSKHSSRRGLCLPNMLVLSLIGLLIVNIGLVQGATCSSGNENCHPWETIGTEEIRYGDGSIGTCPLYLHSYDLDYNTNVYFSGITTSARLVHGASVTANKCTSGNWRQGSGTDYYGYVAKFTNGALAWNKFF